MPKSQAVLAVAYSFPPDSGSGAIRNVKLLRHVPAQGWTLLVLTVRSGDRAADDETDRRNGDEFGVIRTRCFYTHDVLVTLKDLATLRWLRRRFKQKTAPRRQSIGSVGEESGQPARSRGVKALIENLLAIPDKYIGWWPFAVWSGARSLLRERADVIYAVGKPWTGFFVGYALKVLFRRPLVIDFMDPWRASPWARSKGRLLDRVQDRLERFIVRRADHVIANTQELAEDFVRRLGVPPERVTVVTCGYDPRDVATLSAERAEPNRQFTITHAGSFYKLRTPLHFLKALKRLFDDGLVPVDRVRVSLVGNLRVNDPELASLLADPRIAAAVHRESWMPHAEAVRYMQSSDVLLLVQPETQLQIPAKLYEYAAVGRPILALADSGGAVDNLLRREGWGSAVRYDDVDSIAAELQRLYQSWCEGRLPQQGSLHGVEAYSYPSLAGRLAEVFDSLRRTEREVEPVPEEAAV